MPEEDLVDIKFRLYDGTDIGPFSYSSASTVDMLKQRVVSDWPKGEGKKKWWRSFLAEFWKVLRPNWPREVWKGPSQGSVLLGVMTTGDVNHVTTKKVPTFVQFVFVSAVIDKNKEHRERDPDYSSF
ncbi:hypothetical protein COP2_008484 [Malus domestica]